MKLGEIIKYLDKLSNVVIWQTDVYINKHKPEMVFEGTIMDIPWIYLDYYLDNSENTEAIEACRYENDKSGFIISIREGEE
jgi:hypothetical protein